MRNEPEFITGPEVLEIALKQCAEAGMTLEGGIRYLSGMLDELGIEGQEPPSDLEKLRDAFVAVLERQPKPTIH
jgi:hypothetical protein